ncbi:Ferritin-like domain protein [Pseudomonas saudimassiliensis]|uniref:Ferritin-like domain protein n=1 Tax=Pseudomonas saudimassiliensis TaxID=1461581 RepID=A0A078M720_9PSED|nr:ferritin-like domain-containing protein [Pseudomonas saudimassiliensis]CEA02084.1 Ferritin-like domain protein [Pseudomonas saudimassiliensis]CEF25724.1 Ferritin-like domain protein [Pseudomonas saudimassiliensis]
MNKAAKLGHNFTGAQMSPDDTAKMVEYVGERPADMPGDATDLARAREQMNREEGDVGSVPIPGSVKGMLKSTFDKMLGNNPEVLIDKLGERLAYERTGVRLYEALIAKAAACETGSELIPTLKQIRDDEEAHMFLLIEAIETLGADPTAQTPCADLTGVLGSGALKVITDPRTNLAQALNAMLTIELTDNAAWELLIKLADDSGHANIGSSFTHALTEEQRHLNTIRSLLARELGIAGA